MACSSCGNSSGNCGCSSSSGCGCGGDCGQPTKIITKQGLTGPEGPAGSTGIIDIFSAFDISGVNTSDVPVFPLDSQIILQPGKYWFDLNFIVYKDFAANSLSSGISFGISYNEDLTSFQEVSSVPGDFPSPWSYGLSPIAGKLNTGGLFERIIELPNVTWGSESGPDTSKIPISITTEGFTFTNPFVIRPWFVEASGGDFIIDNVFIKSTKY